MQIDPFTLHHAYLSDVEKSKNERRRRRFLRRRAIFRWVIKTLRAYRHECY